MSGRAGGGWHRNGDRAMDGSYDGSQQSMQEGGDNRNSSRGNSSGLAQAMTAPRPTPPTRSSSGPGVRRGSTWREANSNGPPRRMEVSIPQKNLRVFASAVQCLMKVGKELFIEATADQLIFRTLNDAKSAFAAFYFNDSRGFFETFRCDASKAGHDRQDGHDGFDTQGSAAGGSGSVSCKVLVRAVHSILRTLKKVVRLVIYVEGEDDEHIEPHLVFQMYCEFGYRKVHRFSLQDCEILHAVFDGEGASRLSCPPVQLSQLLEHIHGTAEVAVGASHDLLTVRSYHHPLTGSAERTVLKTEMSISTAEFDTYRFYGTDDEEVELVFSLKEVKALLHFSEATEAQTLEMLFREGGDPLLFQSHSKTFAAELIMATMEPKIIRKEPGPGNFRDNAMAPPPQQPPPPPSQGETGDTTTSSGQGGGNPRHVENQDDNGREGRRHSDNESEHSRQGGCTGGDGGMSGSGGGDRPPEDGEQDYGQPGSRHEDGGRGEGWSQQDREEGRETGEEDEGKGDRRGGRLRHPAGGRVERQESETTGVPAELDAATRGEDADEDYRHSNDQTSDAQRLRRRGASAGSRSDSHSHRHPSQDGGRSATTSHDYDYDYDYDYDRTGDGSDRRDAGGHEEGMARTGRRDRGEGEREDENEEDPQSEMPTQFPGLRAAFDSASAGSPDLGGRSEEYLPRVGREGRGERDRWGRGRGPGGLDLQRLGLTRGETGWGQGQRKATAVVVGRRSTIDLFRGAREGGGGS